MNTKIEILKYSEYPGPRYIDQGEFSGEDFYHKVLNKAFSDTYIAGDTLTVILDNTAGYMSSFLDQAFGCLVYDFGEDVVNKHLEIISKQEPDWIEMLKKESFPQWESRRKDSKNPKKTSEHEGWFRRCDNKSDLELITSY